MKKLLVCAICMILLTSCRGNAKTATSLPQLSATVTQEPTDTLIPTSLPTNTTTPSPTPLPTSTPTATITPTLLPTPDLPVSLGDSLPQPLLPLTLNNVAAISELARFGSARLYDTVISSDRSRIFSLSGDGIKAYQVDNMKHLASFTDIDPLMNSWGISTWGFTSSSDGGQFSIITAQGQAQVYDLQAGLIYSTTLPAFWATISPDGQSLVLPKLGEDEWSPWWQLVEIASGEVLATGVGLNARFSPAGTYLVGDASETLYIYRTSDWQQQTQIGLRAGGETALEWRFSPDERYLAVTMPDGITVWEVTTRQRVRQINPVTGADAQITQVIFSEDSRQMAVIEAIERRGSRILIWDITDGSLVSNQTTDEAGFYNFDLVLLDSTGLRGYLVPRESDGSGYQSPLWPGWQMLFELNYTDLILADLTGWDASTNQPIYKACTYALFSEIEVFCQQAMGVLGLTSDGLGNYFSLWQEPSGDVALYRGLEHTDFPLVSFSTSGHPISLLGVSPDHNLLVYSLGNAGSTLQVRSLVSNQLLVNEETTGMIEQVRFTHDGSRFAASINNPDHDFPQLLVYDAAQNAVLYRLAAQELMSGSHALLSPDGLRLVYRFERRDALRWQGIQVWDPLHQRQITEWPGSMTESGYPMAFSPDGKLLATVDNTGKVFLLDAEVGTVVYQWKAHLDAILSLAFSPDGTLVVTSSTDGFIRFWGVFP